MAAGLLGSPGGPPLAGGGGGVSGCDASSSAGMSTELRRRRPSMPVRKWRSRDEAAPFLVALAYASWALYRWSSCSIREPTMTWRKQLSSAAFSLSASRSTFISQAITRTSPWHSTVP